MVPGKMLKSPVDQLLMLYKYSHIVYTRQDQRE